MLSVRGCSSVFFRVKNKASIVRGVAKGRACFYDIEDPLSLFLADLMILSDGDAFLYVRNF